MSDDYAYLDHNVVDRIDTNLQEPLVRFFEENELIPVVSTASLGEIERGERSERVTANIKGLLDLGAKFILEADSRIYVAALSWARISELLDSKNKLVADTVNLVNAAQFYLINCTSKDDLELRIEEVTAQIRVLVDRYDGADTKASTSILKLADLMEAVQVRGVPPEYNWAGDLRSKLAIRCQMPGHR